MNFFHYFTNIFLRCFKTMYKIEWRFVTLNLNHLLSSLLKLLNILPEFVRNSRQICNSISSSVKKKQEFLKHYLHKLFSTTVCSWLTHSKLELIINNIYFSYEKGTKMFWLGHNNYDAAQNSKTRNFVALA